MTMLSTTNDSIVIRQITDENLKLAKEYVLQGKLVAFPTETVYGLGANAFLDEAIRQCFYLKGRPTDNPLIVHVHKDYDISTLVYVDKPYQKELIKAFMPGPITLVFNSRGKVSDLVSCGLKTLAIRMPSSQGAQSFLKAVNLPIAAPSANLSKHTSPVTAEHVFADFGQKIPMILDGGRCEGGIESTVVDVTGDYPIILRKGLVTAEMIARVTGKCTYANQDSSLNARSPGTKYKHYCPKTQTAVFEQGNFEDVIKLYNQTISQNKTAVIMCREQDACHFKGLNVFSLGETGNQMAARLYFGLREAERFDLAIGYKFPITDEVMLSVENRFLKAFG